MFKIILYFTLFRLVYSRMIGSNLHDWKGSPKYPGRQEQTGTWLTTLH